MKEPGKAKHVGSLSPSVPVKPNTLYSMASFVDIVCWTVYYKVYKIIQCITTTLTEQETRSERLWGQGTDSLKIGSLKHRHQYFSCAKKRGWNTQLGVSWDLDFMYYCKENNLKLFLVKCCHCEEASWWALSRLLISPGGALNNPYSFLTYATFSALFTMTLA